MSELKAWVRANSTLVFFLLAQAAALISGGAWALSYMVNLENRVNTMEERGAAYTVSRMDELKQRIIILEQNIKNVEQNIKKNEHSIDRIIEVMTRELGKPIPK